MKVTKRMTHILALDPGTTLTAWLLLDDAGLPVSFAHERNEDVLRRLMTLDFPRAPIQANPFRVVIEPITSYGMPVGIEVFETAYWIGEFRHVARERWTGGYAFVRRLDVKLHLCGQARAKDANVRQALMDRFGIAGSRPPKGSPLYGIGGDVWSALALAVTAHDAQKREVAA